MPDFQQQQQHEDPSVYYESHYSEVSRPPVIGGSDPPAMSSAGGSNAGPRGGGFKEKKQHGVKRMSTKRLEKSKAVEMDYENEVAPVTTAGMLIIKKSNVFTAVPPLLTTDRCSSFLFCW